MIRRILKYGDDVLHQPALPVGELTGEIHRLIDDMIETMYAAPGIGLAAPQVGVPARIFVIDLSVGREPDGLMVPPTPALAVIVQLEVTEMSSMPIHSSLPTASLVMTRTCTNA